MVDAQVDKLRVFVSSAMADTSDIDWHNLRNSVYGALKKDEQFSPFAIEYEASSCPSTQFFCDQVEQSDFVVCIIGKELREGTKCEIEHAFEMDKRVLLYFIGDKQEGDAQALKARVQSADLCCYQIISNPFELPQIIIVNLKSELTRLSRGIATSSIVHSDQASLLEYSGLQKSTFPLFGNASSMLYKKLGLTCSEFNSDENVSASLEELGNSTILWLFDNKPFSLAAHEEAICTAIPALIEPERKWGLRASCGSALYGDYHDAYRRLFNKLDAQEDSGEWQFGIALVDLRNYALLKGDIDTYYLVQERVGALASPIAFPEFEHCLHEVESVIRDIEEWKENLSVTARGIDGRYDRIISKLSDALFISILYGSFSRLYSMRKYLARSLSTLARIYENPSFAYHALRLSLVGGDEKRARSICKHDWPLVANIVPAHADELWDASNLCTGPDSSKIKCVCINLFVSYFSEHPMPAVASFLNDRDVKRSFPIQWKRAINSASIRLDSNTLINILSDLLSEEDSNCISSFATIASNIHWDKTDSFNVSSFTSVFNKHWKWYLDSGQSAEPIAQLIVDGILPKDLSKQIRKYLDEVPRAIFEGRLTGWKNYSELFDATVNLIEKQFGINSTRNSYHKFALNPYPLINLSIRKTGLSVFETNSGIKLLSLFQKAAKAEAFDEALSPMLETMIICASSFVCSGTKLPNELIEAAGSFREESTAMPIYTFGGTTEAAWHVRLFALKAACGIGRVEDALSVYQSSAKDYEASNALVGIMPELIRINRTRGGDELKVLSLVLSELALDEHPEIRQLAPSAAVELLSTSENDYAYRLIWILAKDNNPNVRLAALKACSNEMIKVEFRSKVELLLMRDASFHLRHHASKQKLGNDSAP